MSQRSAGSRSSAGGAAPLAAWPPLDLPPVARPVSGGGTRASVGAEGTAAAAGAVAVSGAVAGAGAGALADAAWIGLGLG